jgi:hypothetical protein
LLPDLEKQLDPRRLLYRLAQAIDWKSFEKIFGALYCTEGRPALPIRRMVGLLLLKSLRNLSDEEWWSFGVKAPTRSISAESRKCAGERRAIRAR